MGSPALPGPRRDLRTPAAPPRKLPPRPNSGQLTVRPGAAPSGPRGRPHPAAGVPWEQRVLLRTPKALQGSPRDPDWGGRRSGWPECAPCGSPRSCSGTGASTPGPGVSGYGGPTLGYPATRGRPWGASQPQSQTCVLVAWRAEPARRLPAQAACGPSRGPWRRDSRPPRGREYEPPCALSAIPADRPRSPGAPRDVSAPASSPASRGRICARRGLLSRPLPPAALLKALNPPEQPLEVIDTVPNLTR